MKLIFSTTYDQQVLKTKNQTNTKYIGPLGLLNILERELGLYKIVRTDRDRVSKYKECLKVYKANSLFEKSFDSDELNVAKQLLLYRDDLVLCGWDFLKDKQPQRLKDLALVEKAFRKELRYEGISDRWQNVIDNLSDYKIKEFGDLSIVIKDYKADLPNYLQTVFEKTKIFVKYNAEPLKIEEPKSNLELFKNYLSVSIYSPELKRGNTNLFKVPESDDSIQLLQFKNEQLLVDCMAAYANENTVFINQQNSNFDYSLVSMGKTAAGSKQIQANPQIIQIVKLIIPCFSSELNLQALISFLTLSNSPLDFLLTQKLAKQLTKKPGVNNEEWNSILDCYQGSVLKKEKLNNDEKKLVDFFKTDHASKEILKERSKQVSLFLNFSTPADKRVQKGEAIIKYLKKWAEEKRKSKSNPELKEQFAYIEEFCKNVTDNFDFKSGSLLELEDLIKKFYEVKNFSNYNKQQNSVGVVDDISLIAEPTNKEVFWLDFNADKVKSSKQFLLKEEIEFLSKYKSYDKPDKEISLQLKQWMKGVFNCTKKLVFCCVENSEKEKHPLHIRLESFFGKSIKDITYQIESPEDFSIYFKIEKDIIVRPSFITLPLAQPYLLSDTLKGIDQRPVESASSIEKFIEYPFDWVMQYVAKFSNNVGLNLPDENLLKGNVVHKTIEIILEKHADLNFEDAEIEEVFMEVIEAEAAIFLQPEKRFDLSEFKYRFFMSFKSLVQIIRLNNFKVVASEYEFGKDQTCIIKELSGGVTGYIDLYLTDEKGNPFIVDLKWGYSDKKYIKKVKNNEAIQLAIYTAAIKQRELTNTAYFMLNQNKFITAVENLEGNNISVVDSQVNNQEVLNKIKKSLEYRWLELKQHGKLEIGDDISLERLQYNQQNGLVSLPDDKKVKKAYPYSGYKLFKGMLK